MTPKHNILAIVQGMPCIHLVGHTSQHFVIGELQYAYLVTEECTEDQFRKACEARGWECNILEGSVSVRTSSHRIDVSQSGHVIVDGRPFAVEDQIAGEAPIED